MFLKQISIFIENKPGRMIGITETLNEHRINIRALALSDTSDFGIVRLIVADPEECCRVLKAAGYTVQTTDVLGVAVEDRPGGLTDVLRVLTQAAVNIEYMYAFTASRTSSAYVILRVEDNAAAGRALEQAKVKLLTPAEVAQL